MTKNTNSENYIKLSATEQISYENFKKKLFLCKLSPAKIQVVQLVAVIGNTDNCEGKGYNIILGVFEKIEDATQFSKGKGVFGSDAKVKIMEFLEVKIEEKEYIIDLQYHNTPIFVAKRESDLMAQALSKLTPEERKALGY